MRRAYHQAYRLHWQLSEGSLKPETQPTLTLEVLHFNSHFHMSVFKRVLVPAHKIHDVILQLKEMFYGLTRKEVQTLAFENAGGRLPPPFNKQNSNQKKWFHNFTKNFLIWALESQRAHRSMSGAAGFSKEAGTDNEIYGFVCELLSQFW